METNNPLDALRSARHDLHVAHDASAKIPNFESLSRRYVNRRMLVGAALAIGLLIPTASSLLSINKPATQLAIAEKGKVKKKPAKKKKAVKNKAPVVPVASNNAAAAELGLSPTEVIRADQGFRPARDGFSFPNFGGAPTNDAIDTTIMVALFGKSNVCANPNDADCVELPGATDVKKQLNDAIAAGRCEGFSTLSQRFFDGFDQRPNGANETRAIAQLDVAKQISYWWATQVAPTVASSAKPYRAMTPSALVASLVTGLSQKTGFTLGLFSSEGGHSVSPVAVTKDGSKSIIYVYDNNYPKEIRKIVVDESTETWTYGGASLNSGAAADTWTGTGAGSMDLTPMSARKGPFNVSFGATKGSVYRVLVTQKPKKKGAVPSAVGAVIKVGGKSVNSLDFVSAAKAPFNARSFMAGTKGVGVIAYIPVKSGATGDVRVQPVGDPSSGDFAVSMDRPGLPSLYASSGSTFTVVGQDTSSGDSITIEGITSPIEIRTSANGVAHSFEVGKGFEYKIEASDGVSTFAVQDPSGKVVYDGEIPVNVPKGAVLNINHSFDNSSSSWKTTQNFVAPTPVDNYFVKNLTSGSPSSSLFISNPVTTTTAPASGGIELPLRAIAAPTTTTTLAPIPVSASVTGTRFYGANNSTIDWKFSCSGSDEACSWAQTNFEADNMKVSVDADLTSAASSTPYSGTMSLSSGVSAPSNINLSTSVSLTIAPRPLTVTADSQTKIYGDADPELTATTIGLVDGDTLVGQLSRVAGEDVGSHDITQGTVTNASNPNYTITFVSADLTITSKAVTVTADAQLKTYGDADPALTYKVTAGSLESGDAFTGALDRADGKNAGTYAINQGDLANANYAITFNGADLTITAKKITVAADDKSKIFGGSDPELTYGVTGLVGTDVLTGVLNRESGDNIGQYAIKQHTLTNANNPNYDISFTGATFKISTKVVTVTAESKSKTYGSTDPTLTFTFDGLESGDSFAGALSRTDGENVGEYAIGLGTLDNPNYTITFVSADLTITAKAVTVTADDVSKTYGDADPALTYKVTAGSLESGDAFTGALGRASGENVGKYAINKGDLALNTNYTITFNGADLTITAKAVTVTADDVSKTYGDADPALTYKVTAGSLESGDAFTGALGRASGENVGKYVINKGDLALNANYTLSLNGADLTITAKAVTVTADTQSKTYGSADPALTYKVTTGSLADGDAFTGVLGRASGENVGKYVINKSDLALNTNYTLSFNGADLTITAKAVTVTAADVSKTYGDADPKLTYSFTSESLKSGDSFNGSLGRDAGENAGQYDITQNTLALSSNYNLTFVGAKFTISTKAVTVTPVAGQTVEVGSGYTINLSTAGFVGSDTYGGVTTYTDAIGDQLISGESLTVGSNYSLIFTSGVTVKVVAQQPISLTWSEKNGSVDSTGLASVGAKVNVTAFGGGTGTLTWSSSGGGCTLSEVDATTQTIQKNGSGSCTVKVERAASSDRPASEVSKIFTWSNK